MTSKLFRSLAVSAHGTFFIDTLSKNPESKVTVKTAFFIDSLFKKSYRHGLLMLGMKKFPAPLPPSFTFVQEYAKHFITQLCHKGNTVTAETITALSLPELEELQHIIDQAPFTTGQEYINVELLVDLWTDLKAALIKELEAHETFAHVLKAHNSTCIIDGRIYFHLAENSDNKEQPFTFWATTTTADATHIPLSRTLTPLKVGVSQSDTGSNLMLALEKAAAKSSVIADLLKSGDIYKTVTLTPAHAYAFLQDITHYQAAGISVQVPSWWNTEKPNRATIAISLGNNKHHTIGIESIVDIGISCTLPDGQQLSPEEWHLLTKSKEKFIKIKGQWVEIDPFALSHVLGYWQKIQKQVRTTGINFNQAMRLVSQTGPLTSSKKDSQEVIKWSQVHTNDWLKDTLIKLRNPETIDSQDIKQVLQHHLHATLRPYQEEGVTWLHTLYTLKLGGCLADDMGLGKTIQLLSLLLIAKQVHHTKKPHLIVAPASLISNWHLEAQRFTPSLKMLVFHPSQGNVTQHTAETLKQYDVIITTYGLVDRFPLLQTIAWDIIILDEAQIIKNPNSQQTRAIKKLHGEVKIAATGTPIENKLSDLWSIFDFFAPGLLSSLKKFQNYSNAKDTVENKSTLFYSALRTLTRPYILRRLKTDKRIIADLPEKIEQDTYCHLTSAQLHEYQKTVLELKSILAQAPKSGIDRKGLILNFLMRLKQICNHPSQWLGLRTYKPIDSGKFLRLKEICETIVAKQEKVLIFTQFQEIIPHLSKFLTTIFKKPGLTLHGSTPIKQRAKIVEQFSKEMGPPFFILSLKAGSTGLNLTSACHVVHFDRWWNPAVENQATDRSYRIGQQKNVLVYKFLCKGTIEEKINALLHSKKALSQEILGTESEIALATFSDQELLDIVALDMDQLLAE